MTENQPDRPARSVGRVHIAPSQGGAVADTAKVAAAGRRGRGALSNLAGRFERTVTVAVADGWSQAGGSQAGCSQAGGATDGDADDLPPLATTVTLDRSRTVIARNTSPDISFDRSINPYRGCEHGCIYCFARPTHAYLGLSPGLDFETRLLAKPDAPRLLEGELAARSYVCAPIAMGTNTDPYQPLEKRMAITRGLLEVLERWNHPVTIVTKSALVLRDRDILGRLARRNLVRVAVSITTLDPRLARRMEPRAATPGRRLATIRELAGIGVPVGVMTAPIIPGLNDHEIEALLGAARAAGASLAGYVLLRLPLEIKDLFREWLEEAVPERAARVMALLREMRGGKDYDAAFGQRMRGSGPYATLLGQRFRLTCRRLGLDAPRTPLDTSQFRRPPAPGDQLGLFDPVP